MVENINLKALKLLKEFLVDNHLTSDQKNWLSKLCGIAYFNIADYDNALQCLNDVLKHLGNLSQGDYEAYFYRAAIYLSKDNLGNALSDYDKAVQLAPDAPSRAAALAGRGTVRVRMGQYDEALKDFNEAVELAPDASSRAAALAGCGTVLIWKKQYDKALEYFNKAVGSAPDAPSRAAALAGRGTVLVWKEQYDEALADFNEAIGLTEAIANEAPPLAARSAAPSAAVQLGFDRSRMYTWRGLTYMHKKQRIEALKDFNQAIKLDPDNAQAFYWRGLAHLEMRSYVQAENDFNVASRLEPRYAAPLAALAELHLRIARETLIQADYLCKVNPEIHPQHLINENGRRIADLQRLLGSSTGTA